MKPTEIRDAICRELAKLGPGEKGEKALLKAAIGCTGAELDGAIDALKFSGKLGWYGLVLSETTRQQFAPAAPPEALALADAIEREIEAKPEAAPDRAPLGDRRYRSQRVAQPPVTINDFAPPPGGKIRSGEDGRSDAASGSQPVPEPASPPSKGAPTPAALLAEILAYCERTGLGHSGFGKAAVKSPSLTARLREAKTIGAETVERCRAFIAEHPDGPPRKRRGSAPATVPPVPVIAPEPEIEAEEAEPLAPAAALPAMPQLKRRRGARHRIPLPQGMRPTVEAIQSALAENAEDAIAAVKRRHPELWRRAIALARAAGITPASAFFEALERGLEQLEAEARGPGGMHASIPNPIGDGDTHGHA